MSRTLALEHITLAVLQEMLLQHTQWLVKVAKRMIHGNLALVDTNQTCME